MNDKVYTEGFPERWAMIHRNDCTLLGYRGDLNPFGSRTIICAAPKLLQGEAWLATAQAIASAMDTEKRQASNKRMDAFCDKCGIGPPYGENDQPMPNVRDAVTWQCDQCDHINKRPHEDNMEGTAEVQGRQQVSVTDAASIAIDDVIKKSNAPRPKLSQKLERLLMDAVTTAIKNERSQN